MIFQNKKYFYVLSFLCVLSGTLFSEELPKIEDEQMQKIQEYAEQKWIQLREMVDVVDKDPQSWKYGLGIGVINASLYKIFANRSIFKVLHIVLPSLCVSYWVASQNVANKDRAHDCVQLLQENEKLSIENKEFKDKQDAYKTAMIEKEESVKRLRIENEGLRDFYNQTIYEGKQRFQQKID